MVQSWETKTAHVARRTFTMEVSPIYAKEMSDQTYTAALGAKPAFTILHGKFTCNNFAGVLVTVIVYKIEKGPKIHK